MKCLANLFLMVFLFIPLAIFSAEELVLRHNLQQAKPGDYLVTSCSKTLTLLHIYNKQNDTLTIEEIALPENKRPATLNWKEWVSQNAPGNTSWVMYDIDLQSGQMTSYFSFTKNHWYEIPEADNFLSKLLNLKMTKVPDSARKRVGAGSGQEFRPLWQPQMIVDGQLVPGVLFDAWKTSWPRDGSDLSGKTIEVYVPKNKQAYPAYFPYWLQITGAVGKAKVRIVDSGSALQSPKKKPLVINSEHN